MSTSEDKIIGFKESFNKIAESVFDIAKSKGWWDNDRNNGELLMLIVSEIAEAMEGMRHGNPPSDHIPEFSAAEEELADAIIRIMDFASARKLRIADAIIAKMEFNRGREHRHGGKLF